MAVYIQLGTGGSFVAPESGQLVLQCDDGVRTDNSGSLPVTINGVAYTVPATSELNGPVVAKGQTYEYSCPATDYWNCGAGSVYFNADGEPQAGNGPAWSTQLPLGANGMRPFSLIGLIGESGASMAEAAGAIRFYSTGVLEASVDLGKGAQMLRFALVQDATISCRFQERSAYAAAGVSAYPQATAYHDGQWSVRINAGEFSTEALQMLAAMRTGQTDAGYLANVIADGAIAAPEFSGTFTAFTPSGKELIWQFRRLLSKGVSLPFKLNDFLYMGMELTAVGDSGGGIVDLLIAV